MHIFSIGIFFQSAQSQSNPIFGCCFSRANPNPTRFMYIFSIGPTLIQSDLCTFFQSADSNPIFGCCFSRNPNPTRFMYIFSIGPTLIQSDLCTFFQFFQSAQSQSNPIFGCCFSRANPNPPRFNFNFSNRPFWSGSARNIHEFPHPTQKADPDHYTRYVSAHPSTTGYIMGIS
jgi:hypothetical protein